MAFGRNYGRPDLPHPARRAPFEKTPQQRAAEFDAKVDALGRQWGVPTQPAAQPPQAPAIGHGGVTVFDDSADMGAMARFAFAFCAAESCGKCTPCRIGSTRGVELIDRIRSGGKPAADAVEALPQMHNARKSGRTRADDLQLLEDLAETMKFGSLCALGGFTPYPVMSALKHWPEDFEG